MLKIWRSEKILGRGLCSSSIDYNNMDVDDGRLVKPHESTNTCSEVDVFKNVNNSYENGFFAAIRARMEAQSALRSNDTPLSFDDQYINPPLLANTNKSHFDDDDVCICLEEKNFCSKFRISFCFLRRPLIIIKNTFYLN